jgi:SAM-dependent methyltransferase
VLGTRLNRSQGRDPRTARGVAITIVRCRICGLVFPDPQPVPARLTDHYAMSGEDYWQDDRADPQADPTAITYWRSLRETFSDLHPPRALDVGVGSGLTAKAMLTAGFEFEGFEPIEQFRDIALRTLDIGAERVKLCGIEDADYPAERFDLVNFGAVLEHLYDPSASLEKALCWLKPGGLITLEVPSSEWLIARITNLYFRLRGTSYVTHCSPMHSPFHLYEFTERSLRLNGQRLGYSIKRCDYFTGANSNLPHALYAVLRPLMKATRTGLVLNFVLQKN